MFKFRLLLLGLILRVATSIHANEAPAIPGTVYLLTDSQYANHIFYMEVSN